MIFDDIMTIILDIEGGDKIVEDPDDSGGLTRWGIALNSHPELGREGIINLTRAQAIKIYKAKYWLPGKASSFPALIRLAIMDGFVNHGVKGCSELIQKAANRFGSGLDVDGVIGPKTLAAVKKLDAKKFLRSFLKARLALYRKHPKYQKFGGGWEDRLFRIAIES